MPQCFTFCFLQVNQQEHVGMVSTNNMLLSTDLQTFLVETIPHCFLLRREDLQMPNIEQLFYQTEKTIKTLLLKFLQYSWENT